MRERAQHLDNLPDSDKKGSAVSLLNSENRRDIYNSVVRGKNRRKRLVDDREITREVSQELSDTEEDTMEHNFNDQDVLAMTLRRNR